MSFRPSLGEHVAIGRFLLRWMLVGVPLGAAVGTAVAAFLWMLEWATTARESATLVGGLPWLLYLLPVTGVGVGLIYHRFGRAAERGNNLIIDEIHQPGGGGVPTRMAPLVLVGTVLTHLFGGSAGREGTAVQMGGSFAAAAGRWLKLDADDTRLLLTAGIAAGFGAVFGTPLAGALFAVEVLAIGTLDVRAFAPCLVAAVAGQWTTVAWHVHHTGYTVAAAVAPQFRGAAVPFDLLLMGKVVVAAVGFGLASVVFAEMTHGLHAAFKLVAPWPPLRPAVAGVGVVALAAVFGADYLGLGVTAPPGHVSIVGAFDPGGASATSWLLKTAFTAVTLAGGFKGGEVTPLFFVGATLGNTLAGVLHAPVDLFAALGFVAVFAGATNTPIACTAMAIELFGTGGAGGGFVAYAAVACAVAYLMSGHTGVYLSQRVGHAKAGWGGVGGSLATGRVRRSHVGGG